MKIEKTQSGSLLQIKLSGRLDVNTAQDFEREIKDLSGVEKLILDFKELEYVSSSGLRIILGLQKTMSEQGSMVIKNVCADVMDVFDMTGFSDILTIE